MERPKFISKDYDRPCHHRTWAPSNKIFVRFRGNGMDSLFEWEMERMGYSTRASCFRRRSICASSLHLFVKPLHFRCGLHIPGSWDWLLLLWPIPTSGWNVVHNTNIDFLAFKDFAQIQLCDRTTTAINNGTGNVSNNSACQVKCWCCCIAVQCESTTCLFYEPG